MRSDQLMAFEDMQVIRPVVIPGLCSVMSPLDEL